MIRDCLGVLRQSNPFECLLVAEPVGAEGELPAGSGVLPAAVLNDRLAKARGEVGRVPAPE